MFDQAELLAWLGRADESCAVLDRLLSLPNTMTRVWLRHSPLWQDLRGHPRFEKLVAE